MYYHIVKKDGLKYKDLDIKEVDKIIKKEKLNFNNSRIYSSIEDLEHTFIIFIRSPIYLILFFSY